MEDYIYPEISVSKSIEDLESFSTFEILNGRFYTIIDLLEQDLVTCVIGDPGIGKSSFLKCIENEVGEEDVFFIDLKLYQYKNLIDEVSKHIKSKKVLILDALDEIDFDKVDKVKLEIKKLLESYDKIKVFIGCRESFLLKYLKYDLEFIDTFIKLLPFNEMRILQFLKNKGFNDSKINNVISKLGASILANPRMLNMISEIDLSSEYISRYDIFNSFVDNELKHEAQIVNMQDEHYMAKKILMKLALIMEIKQINIITKEDIFVFFDNVESNLVRNFLDKNRLKYFVDRALLKDNYNSIEFVNTELQEFLAAKEIKEIECEKEILYGLAISSRSGRLLLSWSNVLSFLFDSSPQLLSEYLFYNLRHLPKFSDSISDLKLLELSDSVLYFIPNVNFSNLENSKEIFDLIMTYVYYKKLILSPKEIEKIINFYTNECSDSLKIFFNTNDDNIKVGCISIVSRLIYKEKLNQTEKEYWHDAVIDLLKKGCDDVSLKIVCIYFLGYVKDLDSLLEYKDEFLNDENVSSSFMVAIHYSGVNDGRVINFIIDRINA